MARILFTCRPLSGHFDPLLPLADAVRSAGHVVAFASGDPVVGRAREAGYEAFEAGPPDSIRSEWAPRFPGFTDLVGDEQRRFFFGEIFANIELVPRAEDLEPVMTSWAPDVVLHEMAELAAPLVCTKLDIAYVDVGFGPLVPHAVLRAAGEAAAPHWRAHGLAPHPLAGLFDHLYVDPCPPALQNPEIADLRSVQQVRPATGPPSSPRPPTWLDDLPDRPLVYLTLGTVWNDAPDVFRLVIEALHEQANLIVTVGRQNDPDALGPQPANVVVRRFVPQDGILPWCDVVVAHGGAGTVLGALAAGVPLLVLPRGADQWSNADRVVAAGAGLRLLGEELSVTAVRDAVAALLDQPGHRQAAERLEAEIAAMPAPAALVGAIEALA
ncbi:MAG: glycosyltransferase [Acidimicrobiales bacterium]